VPSLDAVLLERDAERLLALPTTGVLRPRDKALRRKLASINANWTRFCGGIFPSTVSSRR
jgi:hypothetical protein